MQIKNNKCDIRVTGCLFITQIKFKNPQHKTKKRQFFKAVLLNAIYYIFAFIK